MASSGGQTLDLQSVRKTYGSIVALDRLSLSVRAGEFLSILGPSGSGKSTALMVIAGFEQPDSGQILLGDRILNQLPPYRRNVGVVFQRYALFPHMSVAQNIAYPLRQRGLGRDEIKTRVARALDLVKMQGFETRSTEQLSGGQQQRVAIARAIVFEPSVLLMDEPMSALDRKLRQHMQLELKLLQRELGATVVLVTHDQEEAMSMSDRVALLNGGRLQQVGSPSDLYERPANAFVADFIGRTNFLPLVPGALNRIAGFGADLDGAVAPEQRLIAGMRVAGVRPENVVLSASDQPGEPCRVLEASFTGATRLLLVEASGHRLIAEVPAAGAWQPGQEARLKFRNGSIRLFESTFSKQAGDDHAR